MGVVVVVDVALVELKLHELNRYLVQLSKHQGSTAADLEDDLDKTWTIQHGLQLVIQVVLDIGNHILAAEGITVGAYADIFVELARLKVIPEEFAHSVKGMAGLRNLLVHEYTEVEMARLVDILNNRLNDFRLFAVYIANYLALNRDSKDGGSCDK